MDTVVFNHLEQNWTLCTKTGLIRSLKKYYRNNVHSLQNNYTAWDSIPTSFIVTAQQQDYEF